MKPVKGFTLIELMIAVAVVGILASIALPSYQSYVRKSKRALAQSFVSQVALKEEEYLASTRTYFCSDTICSGGVSLGPPSELSGLYTFYACNATCLGLPNFPAGGYVVAAFPVSGSDQARDPAGSAVLYSTGTKCMTAQADSKWGNSTC